MKNQLLCSVTGNDDDDEEHYYCWWRSGGGNAKLDAVNKMMMMNKQQQAGTMVDPRMRVVRELERLALVATHHEGLNELRHKLLMYRSGDFWMPTGGITKENMDIPPLATILLLGFSASGKTSLVNLMYSVLGRCGLISFAQTSLPPHPTTGNHTMTRSAARRTTSSMVLKEHNVLRSMRSGFCVFDSKGFDYEHLGEGLEQFSSWMTRGVHHNQLVPDVHHAHAANLSRKSSTKGGGDGDDDDDYDMLQSSSNKFVRRRINCVMVVADMAEIYKAFEAGDSKPMEATRQLFCSVDALMRDKYDERPILILTHGDMLSSEERIEGRLKICECLGVSETSGVYDIVCSLTQCGFLTEESDPVSAYALTEAVYRALLISDRTHSPKKTLTDWAMLSLSSIMSFLASLFAFLAHICLTLARFTNHV